jgi:N-acetylneuraminate synthase
MIENNRCYIIAEIGGNFTTFEQAKTLVDEAFYCGVDAIKLQTYRAERVTSKNAIFDMENTGVIPQLELFQKYAISEELHKKIFDYIQSKHLDWFSTPSHETDVEMLERLGVGAYKIGSDDATNFPFLKYVARVGKPMILATGMCTLQEVREAAAAILEEGNDRITLLHAITSYPTHPEDVNLRAIQTMIHEFPGLNIGYSDHTIGTTACICAAAMGAMVVEKHFTHDKNAAGPDHILSADPQEMKEIVAKIREFELMKGNGIKRPADSEMLTRINNRKSIVIAKPLAEGEMITKEHLAIKRPGTGIPPKYLQQMNGCIVNQNLEIDDVLHWEDCR